MARAWSCLAIGGPTGAWTAAGVRPGVKGRCVLRTTDSDTVVPSPCRAGPAKGVGRSARDPARSAKVPDRFVTEAGPRGSGPGASPGRSGCATDTVAGRDRAERPGPGDAARNPRPYGPRHGDVHVAAGPARRDPRRPAQGPGARRRRGAAPRRHRPHRPVPRHARSGWRTTPRPPSDAGARAALIGAAATALFITFVYRLFGALAAVALAAYGVISYAVLVGLGVTLTLPGLAGFVLAIGMAVDANVLVFERAREECAAQPNRSPRDSVNDSVVVFDRVRELWAGNRRTPLATVARRAVLQTRPLLRPPARPPVRGRGTVTEDGRAGRRRSPGRRGGTSRWPAPPRSRPSVC